MIEKTLAGNSIKFNEEGYMLNLDEWNKDIATEIANEEDVEMTDKHWDVISYLQNEFRNNVPLTIRKVGKSGVVDIKELYALFPNGPLKISSKIAGIPKPVSCI